MGNRFIAENASKQEEEEEEDEGEDV